MSRTPLTLAPKPSTLALAVHRGIHPAGSQAGLSLPEMLLTMGAIMLMGAAVYGLYAQGGDATQGVDIEQGHIRHIADRSAAIYGTGGTYSDLTTSQAVADGVFPDGMVTYVPAKGDGGGIKKGEALPEKGGDEEGPTKGGDEGIGVIIDPSGGGPHAPPDPLEAQVTSYWGTPVTVSAASIMQANDALSINYADVPAIACQNLALGTADGLWDVQIEGTSVVVAPEVTGKGISKTRTLDPNLMISQCASGSGPDGDVQMAFIRYNGISGNVAIADALTAPGPAPGGSPAPAPFGAGLPPAAAPLVAPVITPGSPEEF